VRYQLLEQSPGPLFNPRDRRQHAYRRVGTLRETGWLPIRQSVAPLRVICGSLSAAFPVAGGPDDRLLTDLVSVVSRSNPGARPAPVGDLYYRRSLLHTKCTSVPPGRLTGNQTIPERHRRSIQSVEGERLRCPTKLVPSRVPPRSGSRSSVKQFGNYDDVRPLPDPRNGKTPASPVTEPPQIARALFLYFGDEMQTVPRALCFQKAVCFPGLPSSL
jgi:hypothetical protein